MNLANLRGGLDNITVVVLRIGPWVEPDSAEHATTPPSSTTPINGKMGGGFRSIFGKLLHPGHRSQALATVEDRPYRTAASPLTEEFVDQLSELTRRGSGGRRRTGVVAGLDSVREVPAARRRSASRREPPQGVRTLAK